MTTGEAGGSKAPLYVDGMVVRTLVQSMRDTDFRFDLALGQQTTHPTS